MKYLKLFFTLLIIIVTSFDIATAQDSLINDKSKQIFVAVEQVPEFPGGIKAFSQYIGSNLRYPEVARLVGLEGKVYVSFVIDRDGSVTDVKPVKCLGAGCESEAVRVISMSPMWRPGLQNEKPIRVQYTIPISFGLDGAKKSTMMKDLRKSDYGFVFYIKGITYSIDETEAMLGKSFDPASIISVENYDNPKYAMPDKKAVYLIVIKDS